MILECVNGEKRITPNKTLFIIESVKVQNIITTIKILKLKQSSKSLDLY